MRQDGARGGPPCREFSGQPQLDRRGSLPKKGEVKCLCFFFFRSPSSCGNIGASELPVSCRLSPCNSDSHIVQRAMPVTELLLRPSQGPLFRRDDAERRGVLIEQYLLDTRKQMLRSSEEATLRHCPAVDPNRRRSAAAAK